MWGLSLQGQVLLHRLEQPSLILDTISRYHEETIELWKQSLRD